MSHIVIDMKDPGAKEYFHLTQLKSAIKLEMLGLRLSQGRGRTAYAHAKKTYGFKGSREKVVKQIEKRQQELLAIKKELN